MESDISQALLKGGELPRDADATRRLSYAGVAQLAPRQGL